MYFVVSYDLTAQTVVLYNRVQEYWPKMIEVAALKAHDPEVRKEIYNYSTIVKDNCLDALMPFYSSWW